MIFIGLDAQLQAQETQSLSLDALMGSSSQSQSGIQNATDANVIDAVETESESGLSLSDLMGPASDTYDASAASLDLNTIDAGRAIIRQKQAYSSLVSMDNRITSECHCVGSDSCFSLVGNLRHQQVIDSAYSAQSSFSETLMTVCNSWPGAGPEGQTTQMIDTRLDIASKVLSAIDEVNQSADDAYAQLRQQDTKISNAIASQQNANSGFNWGQFAAMSVGVIAGGVADLDATQQAEIFSSITMDSMNGGGSMSNFQGTMDSLNNELAAMQSQIQADVPAGFEGYNFNAPADNLALETQMINEAAEDLARTLMGEQVDVSNRSYAVQSAVPDASSLLQSIGSGSVASSTPSVQGSSSGFDPAMRPGGATDYDLVGNSSGIQGASTAANHSGDGVINETYSFTCPSGAQANIPIVTMSATCASAMKRYARVMSCNLIDEFESAQRQYESSCAADMF